VTRPARNLSLLVGASDSPVRRWLVATLEETGAVVQDAFCGWDLLRLLSIGSRIDLVVADVHLPSPSGMRTLGLARTIGIEVPFLLIADPADFEVRTAAARLGAQLLPRPLSADELTRKVRTSCRFGRAGGPPSSFH